MHAGGGHSHGGRIVFGGNRSAVHRRVVPEPSTQSCLAVLTAVALHQAGQNLVIGLVAAREIHKLLLFRLDAVENRDSVVRRAVIVAPHQGLVVGVRTNHGYLLLILGQRQHITLVLKQDDSLTGHVQRQLLMLLRRHRAVWNLRPLHQRRVVHLPEVEAALKQADHVLVHLFLAQQATANGIRYALIGVVEAALHVGARHDGLG